MDTYLVDDTKLVFAHAELKREHFGSDGNEITFFTRSDEVDYLSEPAQL